MPRKPDPKSKAGFVRSFPPSTPAATIVAKANTKGLKLDVAYVYSVRTAVNAKKKNARATSPATGTVEQTTTTATPTTATPLAKRIPGRQRKPAPSHAPTVGGIGLAAEIERIVEAKVTALLKSRFGTIFG